MNFVRALAVIGPCGAAAAFTATLALATGSALANGSDRPGSSVQISAATAGANRLELKVSGTNDPGNGVFAGFTYGVDLYLVDTKLLPGACEPALNAEFDLSVSNPAAVLDLTGSPLGVGKSGPFSFAYPVDVAGFAPGPREICAYDNVTVVNNIGTVGTTSTLTASAELRGHQVKCSVTATNSRGNSTAASKPFKVT